jgi:hypothetical protein
MSSSSPVQSPGRHPTLSARPLSANPLSPSAKQSAQKAHRHHAAGPNRSHTRTSSYGRALGKAGRLNSAQDLPEDAVTHHRKRSSTSMSSTSPKNPLEKRNSSHLALAKNSSHVNLRKNKSANALARNLSHTQLHRRIGLGPSAPRPRKESSKKNKGFELGDKSSDEEGGEEAEWEDSTSLSPKLTRSNSAAPSQPTPPKTSEGVALEEPPRSFRNDGTSSPPEPFLRHNRSAPNFAARASSASPVRPPDPPTNLSHLQHNPRSSRAPPAVFSISARALRDPAPSNASSFTDADHLDAASSHNTSALLNTPNTGKSAGGSSSADGGVSHFLPTKPTSTPSHHRRRTSSGSDYDSPSSFLPHYHPQQSSSPEKGRTNGFIIPSSTNPTTKSKQHRSSAHLPSRTQQRLELQRRETMRASAPTTPSTPLMPHGQRGASAVSLHSRSSSHGRNRTTTDPANAGVSRLMIKQDYEAAERQLAVARRFRNPIVEAVGRLREKGLLGSDKGLTDWPKEKVKKVGSRRGGAAKPDSNLKFGGAGTKTRSSLGERDGQHRPGTGHSRSSSLGRSTRSAQSSSAGGGRVRFQRQGSHDDIGLSRSQVSYDGPEGDLGEGAGGGKGVEGGEGGLSAEEEMMRRMWESREVYDMGEEG